MKNIKFKDVAHFYIGCEMQIIKTKEVSLFNYFYYDAVEAIGTYSAAKSDYKYSEVKPILRPLTDLTNREILELGQDFRSHNKNDMFLPHEFTYLLKKGFDLFGLIESGQAINATTIN